MLSSEKVRFTWQILTVGRKTPLIAGIIGLGGSNDSCILSWMTMVYLTFCIDTMYCAFSVMLVFIDAFDDAFDALKCILPTILMIL